jgi:hypothetical protein
MNFIVYFDSNGKIIEMVSYDDNSSYANQLKILSTLPISGIAKASNVPNAVSYQTFFKV